MQFLNIMYLFLDDDKIAHTNIYEQWYLCKDSVQSAIKCT